MGGFEEAMGQGQLVFVPFNGFARMKVLTGEALSIEPKPSSHAQPARRAGLVYSTQHLMAKQLVARVCSIAENSRVLNLNHFTRVHVAIVVPPVTTLFNQTAQRLHQSGLLTDLGLECRLSSLQRACQAVITCDESADTRDKLLVLRERVRAQPATLLVLVFDQAQFYCSPRGLDLACFQELLDAANVVPIYVTAAPYLFQTNQSFIAPENEVYWEESRNETGTNLERMLLLTHTVQAVKNLAIFLSSNSAEHHLTTDTLLPYMGRTHTAGDAFARSSDVRYMLARCRVHAMSSAFTRVAAAPPARQRVWPSLHVVVVFSVQSRQ